MLKRYQVLLTEWQAEHYRNIAKKYDVSFSEMIRMALCIDIMFATKATFPKYKWSVNMKRLHEAMEKEDILQSMGTEKFQDFLAKIYFEARKATELWLQGKKRRRVKA